MLGVLITALKIIFLLGFLIFIHEGGHFVVAKLCNVKVLEFSIGFGPTIWKKQGKETKYALRLIPLGGFVNLEGEEKRVDDERSFSSASIPKKIAIIVAGAFVNIVFGLVIYFILMTCTGNNVSNVVGELVPEYAAEQSGILPDDEIIKINNKTIHIKSDIDNIVSNSNGNKITVKIKRDGNYEDITLTPSKIPYMSTGIYLKANNKEVSNKVVTVQKGSSAEKYGIQANDRIIKINGIETNNGNKISKMIQESKEDEKLIFTVKRGSKELDIEVIPDTLYTYLLGVRFKNAENNLGTNMYYAVFKTRDYTVTIFENLKQLFTGKIGVDQMMGPVGISEAVANTSGVSDFINLMALISLSLGITNLIPFPALDGGKLLIIIIEAIRGKRLKEETEINIQLIGFSILILLALYVTYNDILRIF